MSKTIKARGGAREPHWNLRWPMAASRSRSMSWYDSRPSPSSRRTAALPSSFRRWAARPKATTIEEAQANAVEAAEGWLTSQHKRMKEEAIRATQE